VLKNSAYASYFALKCLRLLLLYMKQEWRVRKHSKYCENVMKSTTCPCPWDLATATEMFFDNDNLPVFLGYFPCLTSKTEHTSASEDEARVWCRNVQFKGSYFAIHSHGVNNSRHFRHSLIIISMDKSFKNSIEINLNHPYLNRIYVSRINIELICVWTQICTCLRLTRLSSSRRLALPRAWLKI
jgi:hypothetical protein